MKCPSNPEDINAECELVFDEEEWDQGDGVWFQSGYTFVYNEDTSYHAPGCKGLTPEQVEEIEKEYNENPPEPYMGLD